MVRARRRGNLFQPGDAPSRAYCNLRDDEQCAEWKAFCERLWERYAPYADTHFLNEIRIQFDQRFWEMYLGATILDRGYTLHKHKDGGPEFGIDIDGVRYWFDAIAPNAGSGADAVPPLERGKPEMSVVPQRQIILRITSALDAKREKWKKDRASNRDGYVIAINDRSIRDAVFGGEIPYVVKALYGLGDLVLSIDPKTVELVDSHYQHRPTIAKASGTEISTQPFAAQECPEVSAVLYSSVDAVNFPGRLGGDFLILHNDRPTVALPQRALRFWRAYWVEGDKLHTKDWTAEQSAQQA